MANIGSPLDDQVMRLVVFTQRAKELMGRDGLDDDEEEAVEELEGATAAISQFRLREKAATQWINAGEVTDYTRRNFRAAGFEIRVAANVIPFPETSDGPRAA